MSSAAEEPGPEPPLADEQVREAAAASDLLTLEQQVGGTESSGYPDWHYRLVHLFLGHRVCDLGAGFGSLTRLLADRECVVCVDRDEAALGFLARRFADRPEVVLVQADLESSDFGFLRDHEIDTVVSINVLEHLENDARAMRLTARQLPAGGRLVAIVPAHPSLFCDIDRRFNHKRRYSSAGLREAFATAGLTVEACRAVNLPGLLVYWYKGKLRRQRTGFFETLGPGSSRRIGPLIRGYAAVERVVPIPAGLSWLCVGRRE